MQLSTFIIDRKATWDEFETLLARADGRGERLAGNELARLGRCYRAAAADLAQARRAFPGDPVTQRLEGLVGAGRTKVYAIAPARMSFLGFMSRGYWRQIRSRPWPLVVATVLLFAPVVLSGLWAHNNPSDAVAAIPGRFGGGRPSNLDRSGDLGLSLPEQGAMAAGIITNNISVTLAAFAGGLTGGLLSAVAMVLNGLILGTLGGLAIYSGQWGRFVELILPHGGLELSLIVVAGAAGLRLGWSAVKPGYRTRSESLVEEARNTVELALGTGAWLIVAGLVEGFVTPRAVGVPAALLVGLGLAALFWALVWWRGAPPPAPDQPRSLPTRSGPGL